MRLDSLSNPAQSFLKREGLDLLPAKPQIAEKSLENVSLQGLTNERKSLDQEILGSKQKKVLIDSKKDLSAKNSLSELKSYIHESSPSPVKADPATKHLPSEIPAKQTNSIPNRQYINDRDIVSNPSVHEALAPQVERLNNNSNVTTPLRSKTPTRDTSSQQNVSSKLPSQDIQPNFAPSGGYLKPFSQTADIQPLDRPILKVQETPPQIEIQKQSPNTNNPPLSNLQTKPEPKISALPQNPTRDISPQPKLEPQSDVRRESPEQRQASPQQMYTQKVQPQQLPPQKSQVHPEPMQSLHQVKQPEKIQPRQVQQPIEVQPHHVQQPKEIQPRQIQQPQEMQPPQVKQPQQVQPEQLQSQNKQPNIEKIPLIAKNIEEQKEPPKSISQKPEYQRPPQQLISNSDKIAPQPNLPDKTFLDNQRRATPPTKPRPLIDPRASSNSNNLQQRTDTAPSSRGSTVGGGNEEFRDDFAFDSTGFNQPVMEMSSQPIRHSLNRSSLKSKK